MKIHMSLKHTFLLIVSSLVAASSSWGPPGPPPTTPVGDLPFTLLTAGAIAGYGYWKSRK